MAPAVVGAIIQSIPSVVEMIQGIVASFDKVPDYPIKSGNTYNKLIGIVQANVQPMPPNTLEQARHALELAIHYRDWETETGDGAKSNRTIIMMYNQVIAALGSYIGQAEAAQEGDVVGSITDKVASAAKSTSTWLLVAGAGVLVFLFMMLGKGKKIFYLK